MTTSVESFVAISTGISVPTWYNSAFPNRPAAILAHGLGTGNPQRKDHLQDRWVSLAKEGCNSGQVNAISYTARGHGETYGWESTAESNLDQFTWRVLAKDMVAVADHFKQEQFIAGGQSMGCCTSIYAAIDNPERVLGLILIRPPTAWEVRLQRRKFLLNAAERLRCELELANANTASRESNIQGDVGVDSESTATLQLQNYHNVLKGTAYSDLPDIDSDLYKRISHSPTLILTIEGDDAHPVSTAETLHTLLPQSTLHIAVTKNEAAALWPDMIARFVAAL